MPVETVSPRSDLVPPSDFHFDPELMGSYEDQVRDAIEAAEYQASPLPSLEHLPCADVVPVFNPTHAPEGEVYGRGRLAHDLGNTWRVRADWPESTKLVTMWRVVDRSKVEDGTGLISSRIQHTNSLGDVESFRSDGHMLSWDKLRMADSDKATPYISFSTDPHDLAATVILKHGYGVKQGQDAVIVEVQVDPDRIVTEDKKKSDEVLLIGGVAPKEYITAYEIADFVNELIPAGEVVEVWRHAPMDRDRALGHWALTPRS
jgi:hypothetical protein